MLFTLIWGVIALVGGSLFVIVWWKIADGWADEEHRRFKDRDAGGPAPTVVKRGDVER